MENTEPGIQFDLTRPPTIPVGSIETVDLGDGQVFALPANPGPDVTETSRPVDQAMAIVIDFIKQSQRIEGDRNLTPMGKANKRTPLV